MSVQERADEAARDLINAATEMAGPGSYELVVLIRGNVTPSEGNSSDVFYTYEWFAREADNHSAPTGAVQEDGGSP